MLTRLLIIADIGGEKTRHIGDEAMLEANLDTLLRLIPNAAVTVVSRDPAWTAARYGVEAVPQFGFPDDPSSGAERRAMLDGLLADAASGTLDNATARAVADASAVVASGGGNLSATWPGILYERAALLLLARIYEKPSVVLGQTIGPRLGENEYQMLVSALAATRFAGVRELPSAALAMALGVGPERIWYQCDDALFFEGTDDVPASDRSGALAIAVTIDPQLRAAGNALFDSLATQLRELSRTTGASLILTPHAFGNESAGAPSDLTEAQALAGRISLPNTVVAAGLDARGARRIAGGAAMVISSRYHPIVFGLGAGTPSIGIYGDEYCRIKLQGALAHAGLERWTLTYEDVARGTLLTNALALWRCRDEVRREIESRHQAWREESRERWAAVLRALDPATTLRPAGPSTIFGRPTDSVAPQIVSTLEAGRQAWQRERASFERLAARCDEAESYARWLKNELRPGRSIRRWAGSMLRSIGLRK
jgi:Uncharacterized conserved protein